jgi:hypothetical protein
MIEKDYVKRMIEALSKVLGEVIGLDPPAGLIHIDEAFQDYLKIEGNWLDDLLDENLLETLRDEKRLNIGQLEFLAELLAKQGILCYEMNNFSKAKSKLNKALIIFDFVEKEQALYSFERQTTLLKISNLLREINSKK